MLGFDGRVHHLEQGYWLKFEVKRVDQTPERPHGLRYSFTLHNPEGGRLLGFDNAHSVDPLGGRYKRQNTEHDHWHRTSNDPGRPYKYTGTVQLITDFFAEVQRVLDDRGIDTAVIGESETGRKGGQ